MNAFETRRTTGDERLMSVTRASPTATTVAIAEGTDAMPRRPRAHLPLHFALPLNLDLGAVERAHAPSIRSYKRDVAAMLLHHLLSMVDETKPEKYIRLHQHSLRENLHDQAGDYLRWFVRAKVLNRKEGKSRQTSHLYRLAKRYRDQPIDFVRCVDHAVHRKYSRLHQSIREGQHRYQLGDIDIRTYRWLRESYRIWNENRSRLTIEDRSPLQTDQDRTPTISSASPINRGGIGPCSAWIAEEQARHWLSTVTLRSGWREYIEARYASGNWTVHQRNVALLKLQAIEDHQWYFQRHATNHRLDTNVTQMNRELRSFLILDGCSDLMQLDIKASQPFFLGAVAKLARLNGYGYAPSDAAIEEWFAAVVDSDLYDRFGRRLGAPGPESRAVGKDAVMRVLYSHNAQEGAEKAAFAAMFPEIDGLVRGLKSGRYNQCAILLQQIEAHVMLDNVLPRLMTANIMGLTVHDSLIVKESDAPRTRRIILEQCADACAISPQLHEHPLTLP
jgi:hypothetical protein